MARQRRIPGMILHVIVRGIGKQILFEESWDYKFYLSQLRKYKEETGITLMAYCLMENHVHLLVRDPDRQIALFMKKIGVSYAAHYNRKYERTGHLFQDRYKSEIVTGEAYLLAVFRYILKNPEKAGICKASDYVWSSFREFGHDHSLTDPSLLEKMIGKTESFSEFMMITDDTIVMENETLRHDDKWALDTIRSVCRISSGTELQQMPKKQRDDLLIRLKENGLSVRQLERLTGINRGIIQKAKSCQ